MFDEVTSGCQAHGAKYYFYGDTLVHVIYETCLSLRFLIHPKKPRVIEFLSSSRISYYIEV